MSATFSLFGNSVLFEKLRKYNANSGVQRITLIAKRFANQRNPAPSRCRVRSSRVRNAYEYLRYLFGELIRLKIIIRIFTST